MIYSSHYVNQFYATILKYAFLTFSTILFYASHLILHKFLHEIKYVKSKAQVLQMIFLSSWAH